MFGGRISFDSAIRAAGGKLVVVHTHDELKAAFNDKTAMVYTTARGDRLGEGHPHDKGSARADPGGLGSRHSSGKVRSALDVPVEQPMTAGASRSSR